MDKLILGQQVGREAPEFQLLKLASAQGPSNGVIYQSFNDISGSLWDLTYLCADEPEAIPAVYDKLAKTCAAMDAQHSILACLDSEVRSVEFNVASNRAQSSSLLDFNSHPVVHPHVSFTGKVSLTTRRLDDLLHEGLIPRDIDAALLDVQGSELRVLQGGEEFLRLPSLKGLIMEASHHELYSGCVLFPDLMAYVQARGFYLKRVVFNDHGWADAVFLKRWWPETKGETPPLRA